MTFLMKAGRFSLTKRSILLTPPTHFKPFQRYWSWLHSHSICLHIKKKNPTKTKTKNRIQNKTIPQTCVCQESVSSSYKLPGDFFSVLYSCQPSMKPLFYISVNWKVSSIVIPNHIPFSPSLFLGLSVDKAHVK